VTVVHGLRVTGGCDCQIRGASRRGWQDGAAAQGLRGLAAGSPKVNLAKVEATATRQAQGTSRAFDVSERQRPSIVSSPIPVACLRDRRPIP